MSVNGRQFVNDNFRTVQYPDGHSHMFGRADYMDKELTAYFADKKHSLVRPMEPRPYSIWYVKNYNREFDSAKKAQASAKRHGFDAADVTSLTLYSIIGQFNTPDGKPFEEKVTPWGFETEQDAWDCVARCMATAEVADAATPVAMPALPPTLDSAIVPVEPVSQLAHLERARQMLADSRTLPEVKKIRDIAEAARVYARAAHLGRDAQNYAAEIALLAARKAGEILGQMEKSNGGRPEKTPAVVAGVSEYRQTLTDTQTPERTAQQWQTLASVPQQKFENYISESNERKREITAAGLLRLVPREEERPELHPLEELEKQLSRLRPALGDRCSGDNQFVRVLEKACATPVTENRRELAMIVAQLAREVAADLVACADKLERGAQ